MTSSFHLSIYITIQVHGYTTAVSCSIDFHEDFERGLKYLIHFEEFVFYPNARFNNRLPTMTCIYYDEDNTYKI